MKIICIGRNYEDHAKEMGCVSPKFPIIFLKPDSDILPKRNPFYLPDFSKEIHYEVELVYKINKVGKSIEKKFAKNYYSPKFISIPVASRKFFRSVSIPFRR